MRCTVICRVASTRDRVGSCRSLGHCGSPEHGARSGLSEAWYKMIWFAREAGIVEQTVTGPAVQSEIECRNGRVIAKESI